MPVFSTGAGKISPPTRGTQCPHADGGRSAATPQLPHRSHRAAWTTSIRGSYGTGPLRSHRCSESAAVRAPLPAQGVEIVHPVESSKILFRNDDSIMVFLSSYKDELKMSSGHSSGQPCAFLHHSQLLRYPTNQRVSNPLDLPCPESDILKRGIIRI